MNTLIKIAFTIGFFLPDAGMAQRRPNVILIVADDMGYGDLGCYGQQLIRTPHLDSLAEKGILFTDFYSGTSVCAPSRAALMTGMHTGHTPVRGNFEIKPEGQFPMPDSSFTIAELFRSKGYATGGFGKWGLGYPGSEGDPMRQGFDRFYGYNCQRQAHNFFPDHLWSDGNRIELSNRPDQQTQYAPDLIQEKALDFIDQHRQSPFFLYLAYTLPHAALQLPAGDSAYESYKKAFQERAVAVPQPWNGVGYQPNAYPRAAYAAMVTRVDSHVGEVMKKLHQLGIDRNTLVLFTSDNGPHREGGHDPSYFNSSGGFRGIKRQLHEGGMRVPMIAYWPDRIRKGRRSDHPGASWDLLPTFASMLAAKAPAGIDGISLLPLLTGNGKQEQHEFLYWEFHEDGGRQAVRMGKWKGVRQQAMKIADAPIELYDLSNDPAESRDISASQPEVVARIRKVMQTQHIENKDFPFTKK